MADPHPARGPHTSAQPAAQPVRAEVHRTEGTQYQPIIRYYKQMRTQHGYRLSVTLPRVADSRPPAGAATTPVRVRPVINGAVVTPAEAELVPGRTDTQASFHVTPAAVGRLREARVQLYQRDRLVAEVPLKMKGTRQTATWVLLCLTFLVPLFFVPVFGREAWLRSTGEVKYLQANPSNRLQRAPNGAAGQQQAGARPAPTSPEGIRRGQPANAGDDLWNAFFGDLQPAAGRGQGRGGMRGARGGNGRGVARRGGGGGAGRGGAGRGRGRMTPPPIPGLNGAPEEKASGEHEIPEIAKMNRERQFHGAVEREFFHVLPTWIPQKVSVPVATGLQDGYEFTAKYAIGWAEMPFYLAIVLGVLTLGSWITHARYPGRRNGKPIPLT